MEISNDHRSSILNWLLPQSETDNDNFWKTCPLFSPHCLEPIANCLVTLMTHSKSVKDLTFSEENQKNCQEENLEKKLLESMHLRFALDEPDVSPHIAPPISLCGVMKEETKDALVQFSGIIMDRLKRGAMTDMVLVALDFAHLLDSICWKMKAISNHFDKGLKRFENVIEHLACQSLEFIENLVNSASQQNMELILKLLKSWKIMKLSKAFQGKCNDVFVKCLKILLRLNDNGDYDESSNFSNQKNRNAFDNFGEDKEAEELEKETLEHFFHVTGKGIAQAQNNDQIIEFTDFLRKLNAQMKSKAIPLVTSGLQGLFTHLDQDINGYIQSLLQRLVRPLMSVFEPSMLCQFMSWVSICLSSIGKTEDEVIRRNSVAFVQGFIKIQQGKNYQLFAPGVTCAFVTMIGTLAQQDLEGQWANFSINAFQMASHDEDFDLVETEIPAYVLITKYLRNPSQAVRDRATEKFLQITQKLSEKSFARVLCHLQNSMLSWRFVPSGDELEIAPDENHNIFATKMNVLLPLTLTRPNAILEIMKTVLRIQKKDSIKKLRVAINTLSTYTGQDLKLTFESLLSYLLQEFLLYSNFQRFPYGFISKDFQTFVVDHEAVVVPVLLGHHANDPNLVKLLSDTLQKPLEKILDDNFAQLASIYLPTYYLNGACDQLNMLVTNTYTTEGHCQRVNWAFPEVLGLIFSRLKDHSEFRRIFGEEPCEAHSTVYPSLKLSEITKFMSEMKMALPKSALKSSSLLAGLSVIASDSLQRLFTTLFLPLQNPCVVDYESECSLHAIWQVLDILQKDLEHIQSNWPYLSWYAIQNCITLLKKSRKKNLVFKLIEKIILIDALLVNEDWSDKNHVMFEALPSLINTLISSSDYAGSEFLFKLVLQHKEMWKTGDIMEQFEPFPQALNEALDVSALPIKELVEEIELFNKKTSPQNASLQRLKKVLLQSNSDIHFLLNQLDLKGRGFSEDAQNGVLHKLIRKLITLTKCPDLKSIANECLGIIGPIELKTTILYCNEVVEAKDALIKSLMGYICDGRTKVSLAALDGVKKVLASKDFKNTKLSDERLSPFQGVTHFGTPQSTVAQSSKCSSKPNSEDKIRQSWWPTMTNHDVWICQLVTTLLKCYPKVEDKYLSKSSMYGLHLIPLAQEVPDFCTQIFPGLVHDLLSLKTCGLPAGISHFFHQFFTIQEICDYDCVKTMLALVSYLRTKPRDSATTTPWENHFWIDLDYLQVAFAAFKCHDYISCIAYCDVWCYTQISQNMNVKESKAMGGLKRSLVDTIDDANIQGSKLCQTLLADSYAAIGQDLAVQGCGSRRTLACANSHMQQLLWQKEYPKALAMFDAHLTIQDHEEYRKGLLTSMENSGLHHTLQAYQKQCQTDLSNWESGLKQVTELLMDKNDSFLEQVEHVLSHEFRDKEIIVKKLYDGLTQLKVQIEMKHLHFILRDSDTLDDLTGELFENLEFVDYKYSKPILKQRCKLLQNIVNLKMENDFSNSPMKYRFAKAKRLQNVAMESLIDNAFNLAQNARENGDFGFGYRTLLELERLGAQPQLQRELFSDKIMYEKCCLFWSWGQKEAATKQLDYLIQQLRKKPQGTSASLLPEALSLLGSWLWNLRSHSSSAILEDCFLESIR